MHEFRDTTRSYLEGGWGRSTARATLRLRSSTALALVDSLRSGTGTFRRRILEVGQKREGIGKLRFPIPSLFCPFIDPMKSGP